MQWKRSQPSFLACQNGHNETARILLSFGADPNLCENSNVTPLYIACQNGHDDIVDNLLNHGADVNSHNNEFSPIFTACQNGHYSIVQILLSKGADVNERQKKRNKSYLYSLSKWVIFHCATFTE